MHWKYLPCNIFTTRGKGCLAVSYLLNYWRLVCGTPSNAHLQDRSTTYSGNIFSPRNCLKSNPSRIPVLLKVVLYLRSLTAIVFLKSVSSVWDNCHLSSACKFPLLKRTVTFSLPWSRCWQAGSNLCVNSMRISGLVIQRVQFDLNNQSVISMGGAGKFKEDLAIR